MSTVGLKPWQTQRILPSTNLVFVPQTKRKRFGNWRRYTGKLLQEDERDACRCQDPASCERQELSESSSAQDCAQQASDRPPT
eukprot:1161046-Pelagomonas_calceolata.AAC.1